MQCPNCEYVATEEAFGDPAKCPDCGVYYAKALANKIRKDNAEAARAAEREMATAAPSVVENIRESVKAGRARRAEEEAAKLRAKSAALARPVIVVDINMGFWSMVQFMVKWALATIPAALILLLFFGGAASIFGLLRGGSPF